MAGQLRKGDVGSVIRVRVRENGQPFNASASTTRTLKLKRPSGTVVEKVAVPETDGSDGVFRYQTIANDLSEAGPWQGQLFLGFVATQWHTEPFNFVVGDNLS